MRHQMYERIIPGAGTAVLLIHGICGTPNHFRQLMPIEQAIPANWSVYNMVLDGHCGSVSDFAHTSMKKWKAQVTDVFDRLCETHRQVVIVAHSMGTLFAMEQVIRKPEKVAGLFMLASPLYVWPRLRIIPLLLQLTLGKEDKWGPVVAAIRMATGIHITPKLWQYVTWLPRVLELLKECGQTRQKLEQLGVPAIAYQSKGDEVVSGRSGRFMEKSGKVEVHTLANSTHYYYDPEDVRIVMERFRDICKTKL